MSTIFLALQCFQCSTMQVKQQKKSSNTWICAVCNHRQSVRQVYARGPMARDIRKFVQSFNMSRMGMEFAGSGGSDRFPPTSDGSLKSTSDELYGRKKRTDWTEYLDPKEEDEAQHERDEVFGVEIITELPQEKPKFTPVKQTPRVHEKKILNKQNFTKRKRNEESSSPGGMEGNRHALANGRSRWSEYLDDGDQHTEDGCANTGHVSWNARDHQQLSDELLVEDEVHPDFK